MTTLNERLDSIESIWKGFSNLHQELGSYSFFSFAPRISVCDNNGLSEAYSIINSDNNNLTVDEFNTAVLPIKVLVHEWTHWLDHTTTLWGIDLIKSQFEAITIRENNRIEQEGEKIVHFIKDTKLLHYPEFYTDYGAGEWELPWKYEYSMGRMFDMRGSISSAPLVFTRFNTLNDELIVRVPFSVASLLECSAMAQELFYEIGVLQRLEPQSKLVEEGLLKNKILEHVYDPILGVYFVAVHCVSNSLKNSDLFSSFRISYHLSRLCLNFPASKFEEITIKDDKFSAFGDGVSQMLENHDRGFLYLLLASYFDGENYDGNSYEGVCAMLETALANIGISSLADLESAYYEEYAIKTSECHLLGNPILTDIMNEATSNAREIGFLGKMPVPLDRLTLPLTILNDGSIFTPANAFQGRGSGMDANQSIEYLEKMGRRCQEFYEACVAF